MKHERRGIRPKDPPKPSSVSQKNKKENRTQLRLLKITLRAQKTERGSGSPWKAKPPSLATDIREVFDILVLLVYVRLDAHRTTNNNHR